jgi:uncharacterized protein (DUF1501 family)
MTRPAPFDDTDFASVYPQLCRPETPSGLTRRRFLQAGIAGAGAAVVLANPWRRGLSGLATAAAATPLNAGDGILVLIMLGGGNDGLNTVIPIGDGAYYSSRPTLAIPAAQALPLAPGWGLHPSLVHLKTRWDAGHVAIVQGVGYPNPNLSHFDSMDTWMRGTTTAPAANPTGWLGRWLDGLTSPAGLKAVAIDTSCPLYLAGATTQAVALPTALDGAFGADRSDPSDGRMFDAISLLGQGPSGLGPWGDALAANGTKTMALGATIAPEYQPALPPGDLTPQLVLAARLINANLGVQVIGTGFGSFDTHTTEAGFHAAQLSELDTAVQAFYDTLSPAWAGWVTVMTFSEFGRRVDCNDSAGTDHGTASCQFVIGSGVQGGLAGRAPSLTALDPDGNLIMTTDFRTVYATVLDHCLHANPATILGGDFGTLPLFTGWTTAQPTRRLLPARPRFPFLPRKP